METGKLGTAGIYVHQLILMEQPYSVRIMKQIPIRIELIRLPKQPKPSAGFIDSQDFGGVKSPLIDDSPVVKFIDQIRCFPDDHAFFDRGIRQAKMMHAAGIIAVVLREQHNYGAIPVELIFRGQKLKPPLPPMAHSG